MKILINIIAILFSASILASEYANLEGVHAGIDWNPKGTQYCRLKVFLNYDENGEESLSISATHRRKKLFNQVVSSKDLLKYKTKDGILIKDHKKNILAIKTNEEGELLYFSYGPRFLDTTSSFVFSEEVLLCSNSNPAYFFGNRED